MAKQVQMIVEIDENGELHVEAEGTSGTECVDLLKFLDFVKGMTVIDSGKTDDSKNQKIQSTGTQRINSN